MVYRMQDEATIRRRLRRSNNVLLSPLPVSSWWSQIFGPISSEMPSRRNSATSEDNTVTSYQLPATPDQIPVTSNSLPVTHITPEMDFNRMQDEAIIRRRLRRSNNALLSPLAVSLWWSQISGPISSEMPSRTNSATSEDNTVTSYQLPATPDQISVTSDSFPVTGALVPARFTAFASTYGRIEMPLTTNHRPVHSLQPRRMVPVELVQDALWNLLAGNFHGNQTSFPVTATLVPARSTAFASACGRLEMPLTTNRSLQSRRVTPLELLQDALWKLLAGNFHGERILTTFDPLPVTAALVPARSTAFGSAYGRLELLLTTNCRAVHSLQPRRIAPVELVQDVAREMLVSDFHDDVVMRPPSNRQEMAMAANNLTEECSAGLSTHELKQTPAQPRRKSAWKRSKRFVARCLLNVARRMCFCKSFNDVE